MVLGTGLLAGGAFLMAASKSGAAKKDHAPAPNAHEDRYATLLGQLKEHAANKHLFEAKAWAEENARLEREAAEILKARATAAHEALKATARAAAPAPTGFWATHPTLKGILIGLGVAGFFGVLFVQLNSQSKDRGPEGGPMAGGAPMAAPPRMANSGPSSAELLEKARAHPDDIELLADVAHALVKENALDQLPVIVARGTAIDPYHVRMRIFRSLVTAIDGQSPRAIDELERLARTYDGAYLGRLYAGMLSLDNEDQDRAIENFERFLQEAPASEQPPMIRAAIEQMKADRAAGPQ